VQNFFFDMKDGVPNRDRVGIEFNTNAEAIKHCKEIAQDFRDKACGTIRTLKYWLSMKSAARFIGSLFTASQNKTASVGASLQRV
jgi:hypothetical protein